jgi:hypothetical protein
MTPEQRAVFIQSQIVCARITMEAMKAANAQAEYNNEAPKYGEKDFKSIIDDYGIGHNHVISFLQDY